MVEVASRLYEEFNRTCSVPVHDSNVQRVLILRGLPGSGKSTWSRELLKNEPTRWKRLNRDDFRMMLHDHLWSPDHSKENVVTEVFNASFMSLLNEGHDIIVDNTNLVQRDINSVHRIVQDSGRSVEIIEIPFNVPIEVVKQRNAGRESHRVVPNNVIDAMVKKAKIGRDGHVGTTKVTRYESIVAVAQDVNLPHVILCDIDGTLVKIGDRNEYDASNAYDVDTPNDAVISCLKHARNVGTKIIFMSARESKFREQTQLQIDHHFGHFDGDLQAFDNREPVQLHMRATGDQRRDCIVKHELFNAHIKNRYFVEFVLDDRNSVVNLWRSLGLTCFQVDDGNF